MARPVTIKDETILEAAREVFLARGFEATTAEVAQRAGVSEGTIFNRFKTKEDLFHAAMVTGVENFEPEWVRNLSARVGRGRLPDGLVELGLEMVAFFRRIVPIITMSSARPGPGGVPATFAKPNSPPVRALKRLAGYFEAEMQAGRVRRADPEIVARTFLGALMNFATYEQFTRGHGELPMPAETFVRGVVNFLWTGLAPPASKSSHR